MWDALTANMLGLLVMVCVPGALALAGALLARSTMRNALQTPAPGAETAEAWLRSVVARRGMSVDVTVKAGWIDGYIPGAHCIGLADTTATSTHPVHHAVAAHELGHAVNILRHPVLPQLLPALRIAARP
jgi:Zn-dependent membrane protease YugP